MMEIKDMRFIPLLALLGLMACETTEGFGRDVENTGEAIEDQAQEGL